MGGTRCSACRAGKICRNPHTSDAFPGGFPQGIRQPAGGVLAPPGSTTRDVLGTEFPSSAAHPAAGCRSHPPAPGMKGCWRCVGCRGFCLGGCVWGVISAFFYPVALFWKRQEFRKPACGGCQVRLYRSQAPACFLVLLEPVSDLISSGGSCLINTHLAARGPHSPNIVSLPAPNTAVPCWGAHPTAFCLPPPLSM